VYQNNEMAAILVYGTGISSFLFKYFVLFPHLTGATDHVSENDLLSGHAMSTVLPLSMRCPSEVRLRLGSIPAACLSHPIWWRLFST
jgi:hypothetical protein